MADQTTIRILGVEVPDSLTGSLSELGHDAMTLAELQSKLARADLAETVREAKVPAIVLVVAAVLLVCSIPVILLGLSELIVFYELLPRFGAYLAVSGGVALASAIVAWICLSSLGRCGSSFERTKAELSRNASWIAKVVSEGGRLRVRR